RRLHFGPPPAPPGAPKPQGEKVEKPKTPRVKLKIDPALVSKARELRDRYLEQANELRLIGTPMGRGKYDVSRTLAMSERRMELDATPLLEHAA
ncbi:MAG: hypothetical protein WBD40_00605, partial [Tepidisphaeraceae bacterium]